MDSVLDRPWTTDSFLAWEDQQEGKYGFDGQRVIALTGGCFAHQDIVFNLGRVPGWLLADKPFRVGHEMRLRAGTRIRYPDVVVCAGPVDQTTRILTAVAATLLQREPGSDWIASAHLAGDLVLPGPGISLPLADLYRGLIFAT